MRQTFLLLGLVSWTIVLLDFVLAFAFRRSVLRAIWLCTAAGWPLFFLRELKWLSFGAAWLAAVAAMCAGIGFAFLLIVRLVNDPRVLR